MNIYDTKIARCSICGKFIGEIIFDAILNSAECGHCNKIMIDNDKKSKNCTKEYFLHAYAKTNESVRYFTS